MKNQSPTPALSRKLLKALGVAITASTIATATYAGSEAVALKVYIDDLKGQGTNDWNNARDDLLQNAFYDAADGINWAESFEFEYNDSPDKTARNYLVFTIVEWDRSPTNFYEFRTNAHYINADGERVNLGSFTGIRSGISVTTGSDIGDHFSAAAEEAFGDALEKLNHTMTQS